MVPNLKKSKRYSFHIKILADPSPINLMNTFFNAMQEFLKNRAKPPTIDIDNGEHTNPQEGFTDGQFKSYLRNLALKVLSLKVAAYIKWNISLC